MKKRYLLIILLLFIININIVNALTDCSDIRLKGNSSLNEFSFPTNITMNYYHRTAVHPYYMGYVFTDTSGNKVLGFCQNPNLSTGRSDANPNFSCERVIFDPTSTDEKQKQIEAGISWILKNSTANPNDCNYNRYLAGSNNCLDYVTTSLSLRIYEMLFPELNDNTISGNDEKLYAHEALANEFIEDNTIRKLVRDIRGAYPTEFSGTNVKYYGFSDFGSSGTTTAIKNNVRTNLINALNAAKNYKTMESSAPSIKLVPTASGKNYTEGEPVESGTVLYKSVEYKFKISGFSNDTRAYINPIFTCKNCSDFTYRGMVANLITINEGTARTRSFNMMNGTTTSAAVDINLLDYVDATGEVRIKIYFYVQKSLYNCEDINYNLNFKYYDPTNGGNIYTLFSENKKSGGNYQRFYVFLSNDGKGPATLDINDKINFCKSCDYYIDLCTKGDKSACEIADSRACYKCEDYISQCTKGDKSACEKAYNNGCVEDCDGLLNLCKRGVEAACTKYDSECTKCTTTIKNAACTLDESNIDINEGYEYDTDKCNKVSDDENILGCIIEKKDIAGNEYKSNYLNKNNYCTISCKEDYHITLPGNKQVNSGRYFSLETQVKGTKTCYSNLIDKTQFEKDLEKTRKEILAAWSEWNKWYQGSIGGTFSRNDHSASDTSCKSWGTCTPKEGEKTCEKPCLANCSGSITKEGWKKTWDYAYFNDRGVLQTAIPPMTDYADGGSASCSCDSCSGTDGTQANVTADIEKNLSTAANNLDAIIKAYVDIINAYNSCSGIDTYKYNTSYEESSKSDGWRMSYNYNPEIKFDFEEIYMNSAKKDSLITIGTPTKSSIVQNKCNGEVDKAYAKCDKSDSWNNASGFELIKQYTCKKVGTTYSCGNENFSISKAKYVKQKMDVVASYITPTQYHTIYPTGSTVVADADAAINNSSVLENGLPVSFNTKRGVYNYALKISNLGEYYNSGELGRLLGSDKSVVSTLLTTSDYTKCVPEGALKYESKIGSATYKNGVYVCSYIVNCPDCPTTFKCIKTTDGKYYGSNGTLVSESVYRSQCCPGGSCPVSFKCVKTSNGYYDNNGNIVTESEYKSRCCPNGECPVVCENCIRDGVENFTYRPITPDNINPNNRDLGANWKFDEKNIKTAMELKAYATTTEIESKGESIYDVNFGTTSDYAVEITMNAQMIGFIRDYNEGKSYMNNTLECYDYTYGGKTYKNIFCYSTFIDSILADNKVKNNVRITIDRPTKEKRKGYTGNYWTTWVEAVNKGWAIKTSYSIVTTSDIGPSWK